MITKLELRNFQCHERLSLELDPGVTVLLGASDVGKSAVIRALRWLTFDRPQGSGFIRTGTEACQVRLVIDGHQVARRRRTGTNEYRLDGQSYRAWGANGPPEPVREVLDLGPENFQGQHDQSYWFCLPAGAVAQQLNEIVDLSLIDAVTSSVATRLRAVRAAEAATAARLTVARADLERLADVPQMQTVFERLRKLRSAAFTAVGRAAAVGRAVETGLGLARQAQELGKAVTAGADVVRLASLARATNIRYDDLRAAREALQKARSMAERPVPDLAPLATAATRMQAARTAWEGFQAWRVEYQAAVEELAQATADLERADVTLVEQTQGICPLCGGKL